MSKELFAEGLFAMIRTRFGEISDHRQNRTISLTDALMSAFAMFSLNDPSLLAFDQRREDPNDNFRTIYGIQNVTSGSQMRTILDTLFCSGARG